MNHDRKLARLAAAAMLCAAGLAGAAVAHPGRDGEKVRTVERVIVLSDDADGEHEKGERTHEVRIERHDADKGEHRIRTVMIDGKAVVECDGGDKVIDESVDDDKERTKIIICNRGGTPAASVERLEQALARINSNEHISAEHKEKIAASLRVAIDRACTAH